MPAFPRRLLITAGALSLLVLFSAAPAAASEDVERVAGPDRITTAIAASERGWETATTAVVATSGEFADALAGVSLAAEADAPLLLTASDALPESLADELVRLGAGEVYVLGGPAAVSEAVVAEIRTLETMPTVTRLAGQGRYETAASVAREVGAEHGEALVALGTDFPDAVSAGSLAGGQDKQPILLTAADHLPEATRAAIDDLDLERVLVVGGPSAVREAVVDEIEDTGARVRRIAGDNRYDTSVQVAEEAARRLGSSQHPVVLATGRSHADALAAGALNARLGGVLVVANPAQPDAPLDRFLRDHTDDWTAGVALGGESALGSDALAAIGRSLRDEPHPKPEPDPTPPEIAVAEAQRQIGKPYRYGGNGPDSFDCSGLTRWAWREAGVELPRTSRDQYAQARKISASERQPGDLIAWGDPVHHVAIYVGDGEMVEAPSSGGKVRQIPVRTSGLRGYARPSY